MLSRSLAASRGLSARSSVSRFARPLSSSAPTPASTKKIDKAEEHQTLGMSTRLPGGIPDFVEKWSPSAFRKTGVGFIAASLLSFPLAMHNDMSHVTPVILTALTSAYWYVGLNDLKQTTHALRVNFPVLCHVRYIFESIRPEIQQYFIESDTQAVPFSRAMRSTVYKRSKSQDDTTALGTRQDVYGEGYEWGAHSMFPTDFTTVAIRTTIGKGKGTTCTQPYSASIFNISAMSYGALSQNAVSALNLGAKAGGFYHNTGEGGLSKFHLLGADVVWNIGTGYFACGDSGGPNGARRFDPVMFTANAQKPTVKMIEIKLSQGAKPSHGGILPAAKITPFIADARGLGPPPYTNDCVSPPKHTAFASPKGLLRFVERCRQMSGGKPVGFKLCIGQPAEFAAIVHAMLELKILPDFITIDGAEGGTGAAPPEFQDSMGMPMLEGVRLVNSMLVGAGIRQDIKIIAAGKVYNGFSLVKTIANGADICNAARAFMFSLGCIQALKCNSNMCPTGITTQKPELMSGLNVEHKAIRVANFHRNTVHSAQEIIGAMGCSSPSEITPEHIFKRHDGIHATTYSDMHTNYFPLLKEGVLLDKELKDVPAKYKQWWSEGKRICEVKGDN